MEQTNAKNNVIPIDAAATLATEINKTRLAAMYKKSPRTIGRWMEELGWKPGDPAPSRRSKPKNPAPVDADQPQNPEPNQQVPTCTPTGADPARFRAEVGVGGIVSYAYTPFVVTVMLICGVMNARYHWSLGESSGAMMSASLAALGFVNDGLTFLLPNRAKAQWRSGNRINSIFLWALWLCVSFL